MPRINNSEVTEAIIDATKIQTGSELPPSLLSNQIVPVVEVNPLLVKRSLTAAGTCTNSTSQTILATSALYDTYIIGAELSTISDVTATTTYASLAFTNENGAVVDLLRIPRISLTVQNQSISISLKNPIQVRRGTNIAIGHSTNVANIVTSAVIYYIVDTTSNG